MKYILLCIILIVPVVFYIVCFYNNSLSDNPADWGTFGDYIGGIYSVVLTIVLAYITYSLGKRDEDVRLQKQEIKKMYSIIKSLNSSNVNIDKVNELTRLINDNELILPNKLYDKLIRISDYYKVVACNPAQIDVVLEDEIVFLLKRYYMNGGF